LGWRTKEDGHKKNAKFHEFGLAAANLLLAIFSITSDLTSLESEFPGLSERNTVDSLELSTALAKLSLLEDPQQTSRKLQDSVTSLDRDRSGRIERIKGFSTTKSTKKFCKILKDLSTLSNCYSPLPSIQRSTLWRRQFYLEVYELEKCKA
jgi:hypothetical protein